MDEVGNIPSNGARRGFVVSYTHCTNGAVDEAPSSFKRIRTERRNSIMPMNASLKVKIYLLNI